MMGRGLGPGGSLRVSPFIFFRVFVFLVLRMRMMMEMSSDSSVKRMESMVFLLEFLFSFA